MADDASLKILVEISSKLDDLQKAIDGLDNLKKKTEEVQKVALGLGDILKMAGANVGLEQIVDGMKKIGETLVEVITDSAKKAAEIQTEEFPFFQILKDSGAEARDVLEGMNSLWQQFGVVSNTALAKAAQSLLLIGTPAENISARLTELSKVAVGTGVSLEDMASAYQRLRQAITNETEPMIRGMGGFGQATAAILQTLEDHFGVTQGQLLAMFKAGQITFADLNRALRETSEEGGRFANSFEEKRNTFEGAVEAMKTAWEGFEATIGKPILDPLTEIVHKVTDIEKAFTEVATKGGWQQVIALSWHIMLDEIGIDTVTMLTNLFINLGPILVRGLFLGAKAEFIGLMNAFKNGDWATIWKLLFTAINPTAEAGLFTHLFVEGITGGLKKETEAKKGEIEQILHNMFQPETIAERIWREFNEKYGQTAVLPPETTEATDRANQAKLLAAALHELDAVMAKVRQDQALIAGAPFMGIDEKQTQLLQKAKEEATDLEKELAKLNAIRGGSLGPLNAPQLAEVNAKIQNTQFELDKVRQKIEGLQQPMRAFIAQWANSLGPVINQVGDAIKSGVNTALESMNQFLVTGKFNAQQLLQQLVLLGLRLIENLILQQVLMAINNAMAVKGAQTSGTLISAAMAPAATLTTIATEGSAAYQAPGAIAAALLAVEAMGAGGGIAHKGGLMRRMHAGGLSYDEVPIIAQEGEIMIQRSVAQRPGMTDFLLGLNSGSFHSGGMIKRMHRGGDDFGDIGDRWQWGPGGLWYDRFGGHDPEIEPPPLSPPEGGGPGGDRPSTEATGGDIVDNPRTARILEMISGGYGTTPSFGPPAFGPTAIPTFWVNYPGVGNVPMAVPAGGWTPEGQPMKVSVHTPAKEEVHLGGLIRRRMHSGGSLSSIGGGSAAGLFGGVHIYAFTDLKALTKHMASKEGQKIIFDTVKGRRVDLGIG